MNCNELMERIDALAPWRFALDWDNCGLLAGRGGKEVGSVLVAVDLTEAALRTAIDEGVDLVITHHPFLFKPIKQVTDETFAGRRLLQLLQNDISYIAMHTNFDVAPGCMADLACERLGLRDVEVLYETCREPLADANGPHGLVSYGVGRIGLLKDAMSLQVLAKAVKSRFGIPFVTVYADPEYPDPIVKRVAICPGSGKSVIPQALQAGAHVLVTGDIDHHTGLDAVSDGLSVIDGGHYGLEHIFVGFMADWLTDEVDRELRVVKMEGEFPESVV
ncbi:MAG: Nif3-like dinuclear metal center hexameric protein [Lachnospiraceae bacterium]|jgi:dinuclear metal center YbgI/SA1388 family protein|nr:Nif3-like dinuclear metal center hexameric protein [Lachnospiraceae bacterium]